MQSMSKSDVFSYIDNSSNQELLTDMMLRIGHRKKWIGRHNKTQLTVGTRVKVTAAKVSGLGTITRINRTRAEVLMDQPNVQWTVPLELIDVVESANA